MITYFTKFIYVSIITNEINNIYFTNLLTNIFLMSIKEKGYVKSASNMEIKIISKKLLIFLTAVFSNIWGKTQ